jgi:zinc finger protein
MEEKNNLQSNEPEKIFVDINPENPVTEIESFCVNCEKNGITRILMTKIPYFKEIILMAFDCPECGFKSSEVQPGQSLSDHGIHLEVNVVSARVLLNLIYRT